MAGILVRLAAWLLFAMSLLGPTVHQVRALSTRSVPTSDSRRDFLRKQAGTATVAVFGLLPVVQSASAYERRDVGGEDRSAITAAFNEQAYQTNNRLEREGFKLDTREEEQAKLSAAMASFSYEESNTPKRKSGYGGSTTAAATSSKSSTSSSSKGQ